MMMSRTRRRSVARPIAPEAKIDLTGVAIDPAGLIARYSPRRPVYRVTGNVVAGMQHERWAAIGRRRHDRRLSLDNGGAVVMLPCLVAVGKSVAGAEHENGRERNDGSHHDPCPCQLALSIENDCGAFPESQVCHIRA